MHIAMRMILFGIIYSTVNAIPTPHPKETFPTLLDSQFIFRNGSNVDPFEEFNISSPDSSISASFISLGATVTSLIVKDKFGKFRDVIAGYDNRTIYLKDPVESYFGGIIGRYANRIKNSTFSIDGKKEFVTRNEFNGTTTLHGGIIGYTRSNFMLLQHSKHKIEFGLIDQGAEGFPGNVYTRVSYELRDNGVWDIQFRARATKLTPIMISSHAYWNLDGWKENNSILDHKLKFQADRFIEVSPVNLVPTGTILNVTFENSALDFRTARTIGSKINSTLDLCGQGCVGYDTAFIYENKNNLKNHQPVVELSSAKSGIHLSIKTDQVGLQVYTCGGIDGTVLRKASQRKKSDSMEYYERESCIVLEQQSWIDGINNPQWGIDQIYGKGSKNGQDYKWNSEYTFSIDP